MIEKFPVPSGFLNFGPRLGELILGCPPCIPGLGQAVQIDIAETVEQSAMPLGVQQPAIIMLAVNLDKMPANFTQ